MNNNNNTATALGQSHDDYVENLLTQLKQMKRAGERIDGYAFVRNFLSTGEDNTEIKEWLNDNNFLSASDFNKLIKTIMKEKTIIDELGFLPKTPIEYVEKYIAAQHISMLIDGSLTRKTVVKLGDQVITDEDRTDLNIDNYYRLRSRNDTDAMKLTTELRVKRDNLAMSFSDSQIDSAFAYWANDTYQQVYVEAISPVMYTQGKATGPVGQAMWETLEASAFDVTDTAPGFAIKVLQKFIWQVKRKALGLKVTNHLMPVLVGGQGLGKSTLVEQLIEPLNGCYAKVGFDDVADNRNAHALWRNLVLVFEEMNGAKKADMEAVKSALTESVLDRRVLGTSQRVKVQQMATFIGNSNFSLGEIIRDNTGLRRFAELVYNKTPDWDALSKLDWLLMWQSVDERGEDPSLSIMSVLKEQQEANRNQSSVEQWANSNGHLFRKDTAAKVLYEDYKEWEISYASREALSLTHFGKKMQSLLLSPSFKWVCARASAGMKYRFVG